MKHPKNPAESPVREAMKELNPEALFIGTSGERVFDPAIIGYAERCGQAPLVVYDTEQVVAILIKGGMGTEEAWEFADFNIFGSSMGAGTPLYLVRPQPE